MSLLFRIIIIQFLVVSCSTPWKQFFSKEDDNSKRNKELMESFEVDKEVLNKFAEKSIPEEVEQKDEAVVDVQTKVKNQNILNKKNTGNLKRNSSVPARKDIKPDQKKYQKLGPPKSVLPPENSYPEDYPEKFKKLNREVKKNWKDYKPLIFTGEEIVLDINYLGVSTGKIVLTTKGETSLANKRAYHLKAKLKTSKYYSYLYELDDNIDSYVTKDSFLPLKFSLIQRESGQNVDDLQLFDLDKLKTYTFYQRKTDKKEKKTKGEKYIPRYFQDPLSVIHFLRGLPMYPNAKYNIPVSNKGKINIMHFKILEKEILDTAIGKRESWKIMANTEYTGERLKKGDMYFWFTTDENRIFLKFNAKISIGTISGDIESYSI